MFKITCEGGEKQLINNNQTCQLSPFESMNGITNY